MTAPQAEAAKKPLVPSHEQQKAMRSMRAALDNQKNVGSTSGTYTMANSWTPALNENYTPATAFNAAALTTTGR